MPQCAPLTNLNIKQIFAFGTQIGNRDCVLRRFKIELRSETEVNSGIGLQSVYFGHKQPIDEYRHFVTIKEYFQTPSFLDPFHYIWGVIQL